MIPLDSQTATVSVEAPASGISRRSPWLVFGAIVGAVAIWALLISLVGPGVRFLVTHFPVFAGLWTESKLSVRSLIILPIGIIGINAVVLLVEYFNLGWERSALRRVLFLETSTARTDFFYFLLRISGLIHVLSFVFTFGLVFIVAGWLGHSLRFNILAGQNILLQFLVVTLVNTFVFYWAHRLMHTRHLFEIHKVHHSAEELNVLTPLRNHPVDFIIMIVINSVAVAVLGADPIAVTAYLILNGLYQCAVHSEMTMLEHPLIRAIIITPAAHKIHHSTSVVHFDRNFGILTLWEVMFGTYYRPRGEEIKLGVDDHEHFNTSQPFRELFGVARRWLGGLGGRNDVQHT
jgi:sterol desaturase/sphingolipid hydroxylase (fatty acid hydroxylase superfamily)